MPSRAAPAPGALERPIAEIKADLFKALAHPGRIRILEVLASGERTVSELATEIEMELSHLSQQLGVLRRAGLLVVRREGTSHIYAVRSDDLLDLLSVAKRLLLANLEATRALISGLKASR